MREPPVKDPELKTLVTRLEALTAKLEGVVTAAHTPVPQPAARTNQEAPREAEYRQALRDTVAVLEATRTSFRSKQLKLLRERIEDVLKPK